ncbi:MAG: hypothetical protein PF447_07580 [Spirochaetaceae bacterium]|jgi:hypothetical protein|nr:hypothetical protein [Spirochaetaceae bacterium]
MFIACLQHVPFEGPAFFEDWARKSGHQMETTASSAAALIEHSRHELVSGDYIQSEMAILNNPDAFQQLNSILLNLMDFWIK